MSAASYGLKKVFKEFTYGALNRVDEAEAMIQEYGEELYIRQIQLITCFRDAVEGRDRECLDLLDEIIKELNGGFCADLSIFCQQYIEAEYPDTWGATALICDPWAKEVYFALELQQKLKEKSDNIRHYKHPAVRDFKEVEGYYLDGPISIKKNLP